MGLVSKNEFNNLFKRLEAIRQIHYAANGLTAAQKSALSTPYTTEVVSTGEKVVPNPVQTLKNDLSNLSNSPYLTSTFSSNISIPSVGDLLKAVDYNLYEQQVSNVENTCANCSHFTSNAQNGNFTSNFTTAAQNGNFTSNAQNGNFTSNFTSNAQNGNFTSNFTSNAQNGNFTSNFTTAAAKGNFASHAQMGHFTSNFTSAASKGNFSNFASAASKGVYTWTARK